MNQVDIGQRYQQNEVGDPQQMIVQPCQPLPLRRSHLRLGVVQMCIGSVCLVTSIAGFCVPYAYYGGTDYSGGGVYTGVFYIVAGLLGFLAYQYNSRKLVVACMVVNIIATCVTVIGFVFLSFEVSTFVFTIFDAVKCGIIILCCTIEFITTIVHAAFSCASFCQCCLQGQHLFGHNARSVTVQPVPQPTISIQHQQLPQRLPQRLPPHYQQHQQQTVILQQPNRTPQQPSEEITSPVCAMPAVTIQQDAIHLPYNQIGPYNPQQDNPPSYSKDLPI